MEPHLECLEIDFEDMPEELQEKVLAAPRTCIDNIVMGIKSFRDEILSVGVSEMEEDVSKPPPFNPDCKVSFTSRINPIKFSSLQNNISKIVTLDCTVININALGVKTREDLKFKWRVPKLEEYNPNKKVDDDDYDPNVLNLLNFHEMIKWHDFQTGTIREFSKFGNNQTIDIEIHLYDVFCNKLKLGDVITINGIYIPYMIKGSVKCCIEVIGICEDSARRTPIVDIKLFDRSLRLEKYAAMIAPNVYGMEDVKKAILCQLVGGYPKTNRDGIFRRGNIHILLLGNPGLAKSQLLKFISSNVPNSYFTSGTGASGVGLTACVSQPNNVLHAGLLTKAQNGVVCIDEFDKMKNEDRVAIREAMEQQTVSIAKAGNVVKISAKCSIIAAANFSTEDSAGIGDVSRFDLVFTLIDQPNNEYNRKLVNHMVDLHMKNEKIEINCEELENFLEITKKRNVCRFDCELAINKLRSQYISWRMDDIKNNTNNNTIRQLESTIRIAEAIAKIQDSDVTEDCIQKAIDLMNKSRKYLIQG